MDLTGALQTLFSREGFFFFGNLLSIASFILTIFVLYDTRRIRSFYQFKGRGPALLKDLKRSLQQIAEFLNEFEEFAPQIAEELGKCVAKFRSLERKLKGPSKTSVKKLQID